MAGEFMDFMDKVIIVERNRIMWMLFMIILPITAIWNFVGGNLANMTTTNEIALLELNPVLKHNPPQPFLEKHSTMYAKFSSFHEAEDWLLENGYKCRYIKVDHHNTWSDYSYKTFAVKGKPGGPYESVIAMDVDYGDGDEYFYPFCNHPGDSPIDWDRFERIEVKKDRHRADTGKGCGVYFIMTRNSTHNKEAKENFLLRFSGLSEGPYGPVYIHEDDLELQNKTNAKIDKEIEEKTGTKPESVDLTEFNWYD